MKKSKLKQLIKEEFKKILKEETKIDKQGNIIYSLEDAGVDYSDRTEILVTWEIEDIDSEYLAKLKQYDWDSKEQSVYTYIDVDKLKKFIKDPTKSIQNFEAPNGYIPITKKDAVDLMDSYYENFPDEINFELN